MLGDVIELSVVVRDLEAAVNRFRDLYGLKVHSRAEDEGYGFKNAILPLGRGHIELMEPTDPSKAVARYLEKHGEGVYLVGFDVEDIPAAAAHLSEKGVRFDNGGEYGAEYAGDIIWVHPSESHGVFVEMRHPESYD